MTNHHQFQMLPPLPQGEPSIYSTITAELVQVLGSECEACGERQLLIYTHPTINIHACHFCWLIWAEMSEKLDTIAHPSPSSYSLPSSS